MKLLIAPDVISEEVDHQVVLLSLDGGRYYKLNGSGSRVWALIKEHGELEKVQNAMVEEYEAEATEVRRDVATLIADMQANGLIYVDESTS